MAGKAYENPLLGHVRMRAMYRALVETRVLIEAAGRRFAARRGLEACWVGPLIDLRPGDLVSGPDCAWLWPYVRAAGMRSLARAATRSDLARGAEAAAQAAPFCGDATEQMLCAVGRAQALKMSGGGHLAVAYVGHSDLNAAQWKRFLTLANVGELPLIVIVLPAARATSEAAAVDLDLVARRVAGAAIPVIPVDAGDAVALYRVAQESAIRAREDGGVVVIECVATDVDPVQSLAAQLLAKGIATQRWAAAVEPGVRALVSRQ